MQEFSFPLIRYTSPIMHISLLYFFHTLQFVVPLNFNLKLSYKEIGLKIM